MGGYFRKFLVFLVVVLFFTGILYFFIPSIFVKSVTAFNRWSADLERKELMAGDLHWAYLEGGEGETLVMLHGFGLNKDLWGTLPRYFRGKYHLIVPDLPGFGESSRKAVLKYTLGEQSKRLETFLDKKKIDKFHLLGFSMGGGVAADFTINNPEKVKSLILIGALGADSPEKSDAMKFRDKFSGATLAFRNEKEFDFVNRLVYQKPRVLPSSLRNYIIETGKRDYPLHSRIFAELMNDGIDILDSKLHLIKSPVFILWGENDRIFHCKTAASFQKRIKGGIVKIIKNSGHMVFIDKPDETGKACLEFFQRQK